MFQDPPKVLKIRTIHKLCDIKSVNYLKSGKKSGLDNQWIMIIFSPGEATKKTLHVIEHEGP